MNWYFRFADRTHLLVLPVVVVVVSSAGYATLAWLTEGGVVRDAIDPGQFAGRLALFSALPGYLLAMMCLQRKRTEQALVAIEPAQAIPEFQAVRNRLERLHPLTLPGVLVGIIYGAITNRGFIHRTYEQVSLNFMDIAFIGGNCFVWATVALVICWRLPLSLGMSRLGGAMELDIYRPDKLKPLARIATTDILVVAGAMVLLPLQSLDADFHVGSYEAGIIVGVPSAIVFFVLPLLGVHRNIKLSKAARLRSLRARLDTVDREDVATLEMVTAHIDRVRAMPNWPIDLQTVTRVFVYVIIPPLAWVGAALVENFVNTF